MDVYGPIIVWLFRATWLHGYMAMWLSLDGHQLSDVRSQVRSMLRVMKSTRPKTSQLQEAVSMLLVDSQAIHIELVFEV